MTQLLQRWLVLLAVGASALFLLFLPLVTYAQQASRSARETAVVAATVRPSVVVRSSTVVSGETTSQSPILMVAEFDQRVEGFTTGDIAVTANAAVSITQFVSQTDRIYTFMLVPQASSAVTVTIPEGSVTATGGLTNTVSNPFTFTYILPTHPTVVLQGAYLQSGDVTTETTISMLAIFNEDVADELVEDDFAIEPATAAAISQLQRVSADFYTFLVEPARKGVVTVTLRANVVHDDEGTGNMASPPFPFTFDAAPTVMLTAEAVTNGVAAQAPVSLTAVFDEDVAELTAGDITVEAGTILTVTPVMSSQKEYRLWVDPVADGMVTVTIPASVTQAVDNGIPNAASNAFEFIYNQSPTVTLTSASVNNGGVVTGSVTLTATFSKDVEGIAVSDIVVDPSGNAIIKKVFRQSAQIYTFTVRPRVEGPITVTIPVSMTQANQMPNEASAPFVFTFSLYKHYLPFAFRPSFDLIGGKIQLVDGGDDNENIRSRGMTTFVSNTATLDFSELVFSRRPHEFSVQQGTYQLTSWTPYPQDHQPTIVFTDTHPLTVGANQFTVRFRDGGKTESSQFTLFYLPSGDFYEDNEAQLEMWWDLNLQGEKSLQSHSLVLGDETLSDKCNQAEAPTVSQAAITLTLPADSDHYLYVVGTVHTQDQNPNNDATYDAFEIKLDGQVVERVSNPYPPISCDREERTIRFHKRIPLREYAGMTILSLENHLRFDNYFNTYTEIDTVWIDDE